MLSGNIEEVKLLLALEEKSRMFELNTAEWLRSCQVGIWNYGSRRGWKLWESPDIGKWCVWREGSEAEGDGWTISLEGQVGADCRHLGGCTW